MQRREFIKAGAGAFAIGLAGRAFGLDAASNRVRLAVMGCHEKGRGFQLLQRAALTKGAEIAVVCDVDSRAREAAAAKVLELTGKKPDQVADVRDVLKRGDVDGLICAAPDHWHATAAVWAMKAGKAIYVEKPCTFCPAEGEVLVRVQKETNAVFEMGSQRRSATVSLEAMKMLHGGVIGEIHNGRCWYQTHRKPLGPCPSAAVPEWLDWDRWQGPAPRRAYRDGIVHYNWHWFNAWGTGECPNNAVHFIDLARWAMKLENPVKTVSLGARLYAKDDGWREWPDTQTCLWQFADGRQVCWEGTSCQTYPAPFNSWSGLLLQGDNGSCFFGPGDCTIYDAKGKKIAGWDRNNLVNNTETSTTNPTQLADFEHMANFVKCVRERNPEGCNQPVKSGVASSLMAHLGNLALLTGETVKTDGATGRLLAGSPGAEYWGRTYEKGWELV